MIAIAFVAGHTGQAAADEYLSGTNSISSTTVSGQVTTGGSGSGGGAGLGGAIFIGSGATLNVNSVDFLGNTAVGGTGGIGDTGGTMNGNAAGTQGTNGANGENIGSGYAYINSGNGGAGGTGGAGASGSSGPGGNGGDGGNGSDGDGDHIELAKAIVDEALAIYKIGGDSTKAAAYTALAAAAGAASAAANASVPPNAALSGALATMATQYGVLASEAAADGTAEGVSEAFEAGYIIALQVTAYELGVSGNGGDGGNGGIGGNGSFGQGGGAGGDGGDGGDAVGSSAALGGSGGDGGYGGAGGFGAGGGKGGDSGVDGTSGSDVASAPGSGLSGLGGKAGFGGGVGSDADGSSNGYGGGGGSAYGGAIFVANGGTLNVNGNSTFDGNSVFGGSSENGGDAGQAAGTDLFMMKGSTVNLNAGAGNTIVFNGTIADDSKASISDTAIASGSGAGINIQSGLVIFNGQNTYSGQTKISGGVLQADDGVGIHEDSNINLAGGVLQTSGVFDRHLGTAAGRVQWTGSGGFAAVGGDLTVRLNNGQGLSWDSGSFVPDSSALLFGSDSADSDVYFKNAINLAGGERTFISNGGADGESVAYLDGALSNGSAIFGDGSTQGAFALTAANGYLGTTTVKSGTTVALKGAGSIASSSSATIDGTLDISGKSGDASLTTLTGSGSVLLGSNDLTITNGSTNFAGGIAGEGGLSVTGGNQTLSGANTYEGATEISSGATLTLTADGSIEDSSGVNANGTFDISTTTTGAEIAALTGAGNVGLGAKTLTIANADGTFSGVIGGAGGNLVVDGGTQTLTGVNSYTGQTTVSDAAKLVLSGNGSIATSSKVTVDGEFDIADTNSGATIATLAGDGEVTLGAKTLMISDGSSQFSGVIGGLGGLTVSGGNQELSGENTYEGATSIASGASLTLSGAGSIEDSSGVEANGTFDIAGTDSGATIASLTGSGSVTLGGQLLTIAEATGEFSGIISGTGGLEFQSGIQTLSGANTYSGKTTVAEDATLSLAGNGGIASSSELALAGTLDISGVNTSASITTLSGAGTVANGTKRLKVTNASTVYSGEITGTGGFEVSGGTQTLQDVLSSGGLVASNGGTILANGGSVDGGSTMPALSIVNGGTITATGTSLDTEGATAYASFDQSGKVANFTLAAGATIAGNDGTLLLVERSGGGSDGIVNFVIDNGGVANGDILDRDLKTANGGTNVTISQGASWTGLTDAASFHILSGGSAVFADGSKIDGSLIADAGATIFGGELGGSLEVYGDAVIDNGAITGNVYIVGDLTLNGLLSPGHSPGQIAIGGNLDAATYAETLFEVQFGVDNPVAGTHYDQTNVGGNLEGNLPITLASWNSSRGDGLGGIDQIELLRFGGVENGTLTQTNRLTQFGHEVVLDRRIETADAGQTVALANQDEETFFGPGDVVVYGLDAFVQDETFGFAVLADSVNSASLDMLGSKVDRRGLGNGDDERSSWLRVGAKSTETNDLVDRTQRLYYTSFGTDIIQSGGFRAGLLGSVGKSSSDIETNTGTAGLEGNLYSGGVTANWSNDTAYLDAVGTYGYSDWSIDPTNASSSKISGNTTTALVEAGVSFGSDQTRITPWGQFAYMKSSFSDLESDWVDNVSFDNGDSMIVRGGVRAEGHFDSVSSYLDLSVAHNLSGNHTVTVDNFDYAAGDGGTSVGLGLGLEATVTGNLSISSSFSGQYGVGTGDILGYQGQARLKATW